eukprot:1743363-Lingulodinium_polyedra.AAC.1
MVPSLDEEVQQAEINLLKHDFDNFNILLEKNPDAMQQVDKRSGFHTVPVQQVVSLCQLSNWKPYPALHKLAEAKSRI